MSAGDLEALPEKRRNALLRRADWRFLLRREEAPAPGEPLRIGFPRRRALSAAREALPAGGELLCHWRLPRLWGTQRARRNLSRAGFACPRLLWPGPLPHRLPQFWLPPDSQAAAAHLLAARPAGSAPGAALRPLWRLAARLGLLAPVFVLARAPGAPAPADELTPYLGGDTPCLLLSGGERSINKVVALPFAPGERSPAVVVKFSRLPESDRALEREAAALDAIERARPALAGVPRLLGRGRRAGCRGVAESAIHGEPLIARLEPRSFELLAGAVTEWLIDLAGGGDAPASGWRERLVAAPLDAFERDFGAVAGPGAVAAARARLAGLGELPEVPEHRDCSPWNVVLTEAGTPALLDWESAEPRGLPGLDLAYFLANSAFVLDGALESGGTRESYARLLDTSGAHGAIAAACTSRYCAALGIAADDFPRLRLLAWIVHSASDRGHADMAAGGAAAAGSLAASTFLGLIEEELARLPSVGEPQ